MGAVRNRRGTEHHRTPVGSERGRRDSLPMAGEEFLRLDDGIRGLECLEAVTGPDVGAPVDRRPLEEPRQRRRVKRPIEGDADLPRRFGPGGDGAWGL